MPISANPNARTSFTLQDWQRLPTAEQPRLLVRFMTDAEHERIAQLTAELEGANESDPDRIWSLMWEAISIGVVGWENVKAPAAPDVPFAQRTELPFSRENFFAELTNRERWAVLWKYPNAVRLSPVDRKN